jgi:RecQ family ATP-dependent DNA helicase
MKYTIKDALDVLVKYWGYPNFRDKQEEVISAVLEGKSVFAILPTSYGKSITFQIPALLAEGSTIVFSPLISLMQDQVADCVFRGISASYVNSQISTKESLNRLELFKRGEIKILYVAPERMDNEFFRDAVKQTKISYIVVDEAHCASQWGHDFRPVYMRIKNIFKIVAGSPPVIAVTATCTKDIEDDICSSIGLPEGYVKVSIDPTRENIFYSVVKTGNPWRNLEMELSKISFQDGRHLVYTSTRTGAEEILSRAREYFATEECGFYHAGLSKVDREAIQTKFKDGTCKLICATCAFGMGIDIPNIRNVIHFGIPGSLEDYCQETGRAGRDGLQSRAVLIYSQESLATQEFFLELKNPRYCDYEKVWDYLHMVLKEDGTLYASSEVIGSELYPPISSESVSTILAAMDKHDLVERAYLNKCFIVNANFSSLRNGKFVRNQKIVVDFLLNAAQDCKKTKIKQEDFEAATGLTSAQITVALGGLKKKNVLTLESQFRGKYTKIKKYKANLSDFISRESIEEKRARDLKRLNIMKAYVFSPNGKEYIRNYFA